MELSIVTTLYRSAPYVREFHERASRAAKKLSADYEIVYVNDGSPDESVAILRELQKSDARIVIVDLSRNFGHHKAIMTGLRYATGNLVFLIDSDLEESPEWLALFRESMAGTGADAVYGVQRTRKGGIVERLSGAAFYKIFARLSGMDLPLRATTARLMTRRYIQSLLLFTEREPIAHALLHMTGYAQTAVAVDKGHKGTTTYTLRKKLALFINAITSFSDRPLISIFYTGALISGLSALTILFLVAGRFFLDITVDGWTSLIVSIWFLGGLTIFFIGVLGIYLARIFTEVKQRPISIVREVFRAVPKQDE
jgi:putative glycosyltransferase